MDSSSDLGFWSSDGHAGSNPQKKDCRIVGRRKTGDRRDIPRVFSQKIKENKCNVPSVPGLWSLVFYASAALP
jgi:hypothetical protein